MIPISQCNCYDTESNLTAKIVSLLSLRKEPLFQPAIFAKKSLFDGAILDSNQRLHLDCDVISGILGHCGACYTYRFCRLMHLANDESIIYVGLRILASFKYGSDALIFTAC